MAARVRIFCVVGPRGQGGGMWWPDVSWLYLKAFVDAGVEARALPIGGTHLSFTPLDPQWRHWEKVSQLFDARLADDWNVNIVCAPARMPLGQRRTRGEMSPAKLEELEELGPADLVGADAGAVEALITSPAADKDVDEVVYEPSTALSTLWIRDPGSGRENIAITDVQPAPPSAGELEVLSSRYDEVFTVTKSGAAALDLLDMKCVPPARFVEELRDSGFID